MKLIDALANRKSIRGFKPDPVSKEILQKILNTAVNSPSIMNAQPWEIFVVTGNVLEKIKKGNLESLISGEVANPDVPFKERIGQVYRKRQVRLAAQLFHLLGIKREDEARKLEWMQRGYRFFDAPSAILLTYDKVLDPDNFTEFDMGCLAHAICLAALDYDLGTCINIRGTMYPQIIRKYIDIPDSKKILISIAIGYPDWEFVANKVVSDREPTDKVTTWVGFD